MSDLMSKRKDSGFEFFAVSMSLSMMRKTRRQAIAGGSLDARLSNERRKSNPGDYPMIRAN
jgi:hypothetical protein